MQLIHVIIIALLVSVLFSMLGLGGAIIYTPLFFWLGIPLLSAIPMALMLNTITTGSASITYLKNGLVDKKMSYPIICTSISGALIGSYLAGSINNNTIILLLSSVLLFASIRIFFFSSIGFTVGRTMKKKMILGSSAGFIIGIISSIVGVGGGTFIVPLLLLLGFESKNAMATSAYIITFMAMAGFLGHFSLGHVQMDFKLLLYTGVAVFVGAQTGSKVIFDRISSGTLNRMFGIVLLGVVIKLLYGLV